MTITLIVLCCIVALISKMGYDAAQVTWLFYSDQPSYRLAEELETRMEQLSEEEQENSEEYDKLLAQYDQVWEQQPPPFAEIQKGQAWRLITPMLIHFGPVHLIFNMYWLWILGRMLESILRRTRFLLLILVISAGSSTVEAAFAGTNFGGMSGVIYGLFGFIVVLGKIHPMGAPHLDPRTVRFMLIWLVLCFTGFIGPIANAAHVSGLIIGGLMGGIHGLRNGGWKHLQRKREFHQAIAAGSGCVYRCVVCGKTEDHDPDLEFRVGADGKDYCSDHLPSN